MGLFLNLPTPATIAAAVRAELAPELDHLDADISSRATPADVHVTVDAIPDVEVGP